MTAPEILVTGLWLLCALGLGGLMADPRRRRVLRVLDRRQRITNWCCLGIALAAAAGMCWFLLTHVRTPAPADAVFALGVDRGSALLLPGVFLFLGTLLVAYPLLTVALLGGLVMSAKPRPAMPLRADQAATLAGTDAVAGAIAGRGPRLLLGFAAAVFLPAMALLGVMRRATFHATEAGIVHRSAFALEPTAIAWRDVERAEIWLGTRERKSDRVATARFWLRSRDGLEVLLADDSFWGLLEELPAVRDALRARDVPVTTTGEIADFARERPGHPLLRDR